MRCTVIILFAKVETWQCMRLLIRAQSSGLEAQHGLIYELSAVLTVLSPVCHGLSCVFLLFLRVSLAWGKTRGHLSVIRTNWKRAVVKPRFYNLWWKALTFKHDVELHLSMCVRMNTSAKVEESYIPSVHYQALKP